MPGCLAGDLSSCALCEFPKFPATIIDKNGADQTACYDGFFGLFGNQLRRDEVCDVENCDACMYEAAADSKTCSRCKPGFYMVDDFEYDAGGNQIGTDKVPFCREQSGSKTIDLFLFSFEGIWMTAEDLVKAKS